MGQTGWAFGRREKWSSDRNYSAQRRGFAAVPPLLNDAHNFDARRVLSDKAYSSHYNLQLAETANTEKTGHEVRFEYISDTLPRTVGRLSGNFKQ